MAAMSQLILQLVTPPKFTFDNLVVHEGIEQAFHAIQRVYGTGEPPLPPVFLHGVQGTGKTHILRALASFLSERFCGGTRGVAFVHAVGDPPSFPEMAKLVEDEQQELRSLFGVLVDDVHLVRGEDSGHLWNLCNKLTRSGAALVMASLAPPEEIFRDDPHLSSRIASGLVFRLDPPPDQVRILILDKMARDMNLRVSHDISNYLVTRKSRNIKELNKVLAVLDRASLEQKRRITLPLIKQLEREGLI